MLYHKTVRERELLIEKTMKKNSFGILLAHIRLEHQEIIKDMSDKLNMSPAYLSSIETGRRSVPEDMIQKLKETYSLDQETVHKLEIAKAELNLEVNMKINAETTKDQIALATLFSKTFTDLSAEQINQIRTLLETFEKQNTEAKM